MVRHGVQQPVGHLGAVKSGRAVEPVRVGMSGSQRAAQVQGRTCPKAALLGSPPSNRTSTASMNRRRHDDADARHMAATTMPKTLYSGFPQSRATGRRGVILSMMMKRQKMMMPIRGIEQWAADGRVKPFKFWSCGSPLRVVSMSLRCHLCRRPRSSRRTSHRAAVLELDEQFSTRGSQLEQRLRMMSRMMMTTAIRMMVPQPMPDLATKGAHVVALQQVLLVIEPKALATVSLAILSPADQVTSLGFAPATARPCCWQSRGCWFLPPAHLPVELAQHVGGFGLVAVFEVVLGAHVRGGASVGPSSAARRWWGAPMLQPSSESTRKAKPRFGCRAGIRSSQSARRRRAPRPCGAESPPPASARPATGLCCPAG